MTETECVKCTILISIFADSKLSFGEHAKVHYDTIKLLLFFDALNTDGSSALSTTRVNKNLAIANRSRVSCARNNRRGHLRDLKSRLRVTQGHWKRNHWTDHTRLTIRQVVGCWILSWPYNVGQRSLKVIEISAIRKLWFGFLFAFYSN